MKLDFLPNGPNNAGLIRLYDYSQSDVHALSKIASELATGPRKQVALQSESWLVPIGGCKLILQRGERDFGIRQAAPLNFECELSADGWNNVEGLLEPFCNPATTGFQWLTSQGRISFLISNNGTMANGSKLAVPRYSLMRRPVPTWTVPAFPRT